MNIRSIKSTGSQPFGKKSARWLSRVGFALALTASPMMATPASAFDNANDCTAEVTKIIQDLLKADMTSEQVNFVYEAINQAEEGCANGDFSAAQQAIDLGKERLKEATSG